MVQNGEDVLPRERRQGEPSFQADRLLWSDSLSLIGRFQSLYYIARSSQYHTCEQPVRCYRQCQLHFWMMNLAFSGTKQLSGWRRNRSTESIRLGIRVKRFKLLPLTVFPSQEVKEKVIGEVIGEVIREIRGDKPNEIIKSPKKT